MQFDVFISYAWTDDDHREWVRLLAACLRSMGFNVGIDAKVDYGNDLDGFMRRIPESLHVLMIVDDNYADRADNSRNPVLVWRTWSCAVQSIPNRKAGSPLF